MSFKKLSLLAVLFSGLVLPSSAETKYSREENIDRIVDSMGLEKTWKLQVEQSKAMNLKQNLSVLEEMLSSQDLSIEEQVCMKELYEDVLVNEIENSVISADTMLELWKKNYGKDLSDKELNEIADYLSSDLAKKIVAVERATLVKFTADLSELRMAKSKDIAADLLDDIAKSVNKSDCEKKEN